MRKIAVILLWTAMLLGCQAPESVQTGRIKPEMKGQYDVAFQEMLSKPGDLAAALRYATVAKQAGDLEGAISTYEGMLLIDADQPRVRVELGLLYYRLKSYDVARSHLEAAVQSSALPADLRKPTEQLLSKMPKQSRARA